MTNNCIKIIAITFLSALMSCGISASLLRDNVTKVPRDSNVYSKASHFDLSLLSIIDTSVIYEEFEIRYGVLSRLDTNMETRTYGNYKFYSNGRLNYFILDRNEDLLPQMFDPAFTGYRGIYYLDEGRIRGDLFTSKSGMGELGKLSSTFEVKADTLFEVVRNREIKYKRMYVKRKLLPVFSKNSW